MKTQLKSQRMKGGMMPPGGGSMTGAQWNVNANANANGSPKI